MIGAVRGLTEIRARFDRVQDDVGPAVTVVAATKYVALADMALLVEAGVTVVGENRAQDLEAKHAEYGDAFTWHFIGHLQSNKVKVVNRICELVHSLDSESAARRLEVPGARPGQPRRRRRRKSGVEPDELAGVPRLRRRGLSTMPPAAASRGGLAPVVRAAPRSGRRARPEGALDGHDAGLRRGRRGGRDVRSRRIDPVSE